MPGVGKKEKRLLAGQNEANFLKGFFDTPLQWSSPRFILETTSCFIIVCPTQRHRVLGVGTDPAMSSSTFSCVKMGVTRPLEMESRSSDRMHRSCGTNSRRRSWSTSVTLMWCRTVAVAVVLCHLFVTCSALPDKLRIGKLFYNFVVAVVFVSRYNCSWWCCCHCWYCCCCWVVCFASQRLLICLLGWWLVSAFSGRQVVLARSVTAG